MSLFTAAGSLCSERVKSACFLPVFQFCGGIRTCSKASNNKRWQEGKLFYFFIFYKWLMLPVGRHPETHPFHPRFHFLEFNSERFLFGFVYIDVNSLFGTCLYSQVELLTWRLFTFNNGFSYNVRINMCFFFLSFIIFLTLSLLSLCLMRSLVYLTTLSFLCVDSWDCRLLFSLYEVCKCVFFLLPPGLWQSSWSSQGRQEWWMAPGFIIL